MKTMIATIIALTATAAMATEPATHAAKPAAPAATTHEVAKKDCTKMTGEAKTKCEAEMKAHK